MKKNQLEHEEMGKSDIIHRKKLVIVGDGACGKTSLLFVFTKDEMPMNYVPTIFENYVADMNIDGKQVELALFDSAGQEEYDQLRPLMYPETDVVVICFSIDSPDSLYNTAEKWSPEVKHFCQDVPVILVGNKKDLRNNPDALAELAERKQTPVTYEEGQEMSKKVGAAEYLECSAMTKLNVDVLFESAARLSLKHKRKPHTKKCCKLL